MSVEQGGNKDRGKEPVSYSNVKFIYFDVGDVLMRFSGGLQSIGEKVGLSYEECLKIWLEMDNEICRGDTNPQELWNKIKAVSNYKGKNIDFVSFWVNHFGPIPEVHNLVRKLSKDREVGLLTNIYPGVYPLALETGKIPKLPYASVIQSSEVHFIKPEQAIYEIAKSKAGVKPEEILFIDNNPQFLSPASSEGWNTFLFEPEKVSKNVEILQIKFDI
jgi:HAD superfamily hydrolase (TIGR01509 family)